LVSVAEREFSIDLYRESSSSYVASLDNIRTTLEDWKNKYKGNNALAKWAFEDSNLDIISSLGSGIITGKLDCESYVDVQC
jgi:hypothetical protein